MAECIYPTPEWLEESLKAFGPEFENKLKSLSGHFGFHISAEPKFGIEKDLLGLFHPHGVDKIGEVPVAVIVDKAGKVPRAHGYFTGQGVQAEQRVKVALLLQEIVPNFGKFTGMFFVETLIGRAGRDCCC